tara:strand:- start:3369 stop:4673 length:1305 start_codon:yes stop_codon:yes gene_type:complete
MGRKLNVLILDCGGDAALARKGLDASGFVMTSWPVDATPDRLAQPVWDAILIVADTEDDVLAAVQQVKNSPSAGTPILACSDFNPLPFGVQAWLRPPASSTQLAARIRTLSRLRTMEDIVLRRRAAAHVFDKSLQDDLDEDGRACVLFVGEATPRFMHLRYALSDINTDVIAAFSSYSAFDYLHERPFDAVVLNAMKSTDIAFTISSAMRRNTRLYHTPVLLLARAGLKDAAEEAFARGVSDLLPDNATDEEIRGRILILAEERRRRRRAKRRLEACRTPKTLDEDTGLYRERFALAHLQDLLNATRRNERATGLVLLRLGAPEHAQSDSAIRDARKQFASMLRHLLRAEDCAACLAPDLFAAILPMTDAEGAACVAERVAAIADCTAFEGDDPLRPFRLSVQTAAVDAMGEETAEAFIERAQRLFSTPKTKAL